MDLTWNMNEDWL